MIIRNADQYAFQVAVEWAANEGWNPGLDDLAPFFAADPDGFLMGYIGDEPVACISVVRYGAEFGFLGFYIVSPAHRGQGYGWKIWQVGMDYLAGRTVGLDGVVEQQENYQKSGFVFAHNNIRFAGSIGAPSQIDPQIVPAAQVDTAKLVAYDRSFFPADRSGFIVPWMSEDLMTRQTLAHVEKDQVVGLGTIRQCREGYKIGPLFADTPDIAEQLLTALVADSNGQNVFLDVPQPNDQAMALATKFDLVPIFETARMYRGRAPNLPLSSMYGVTTFELG